MTSTATLAPLPPGKTIGILGGGQLGRMLAMAAARLGFRTHVYCLDPNDPAAQVASASTVAKSYTDEAALASFAGNADVVTYEFENVPVSAADFAGERVAVWPPPSALAIAQDRFEEKTFLRSAGIATTAFAPVSDVPSLRRGLAEVGTPAVLKTRRFGYDGKGQATIESAEDAERGWEALGGAPSILEAYVPFDMEVSVIGARTADGQVACYDPARNTHEDHILAESAVPSGLPEETAALALTMTERIAASLHYVGVLGVEFFVRSSAEPRLVVNEIAPRVHNSGHWTLDACAVSQFEQHVRAICGWPLGSPRRHSDAVMRNLLGEQIGRWRELSGTSDTAIHIYGKNRVSPGRKMGHVTRLRPMA